MSMLYPSDNLFPSGSLYTTELYDSSEPFVFDYSGKYNNISAGKLEFLSSKPLAPQKLLIATKELASSEAKSINLTNENLSPSAENSAKKNSISSSFGNRRVTSNPRKGA